MLSVFSYRFMGATITVFLVHFFVKQNKTDDFEENQITKVFKNVDFLDMLRNGDGRILKKIIV